MITRPEVVRRCMWSRNFKNEEVMTRVESQRHTKKKDNTWEGQNIFRFCTIHDTQLVTGYMNSSCGNTVVSGIYDLVTLQRRRDDF